MTNNKPRVLISVEGGVVQFIRATQDMDILTVDRDNGCLTIGDETEWGCNLDEIVSQEEFQRKVDEIDAEIKENHRKTIDDNLNRILANHKKENN